MSALLLFAVLAAQAAHFGAPSLAVPVTVTDVNRVVAAVLAQAPGICPWDLNGDNVCDVRDVQKVVEAVINTKPMCVSTIAMFNWCVPPLSTGACRAGGAVFKQVLTICESQ